MEYDIVHLDLEMLISLDFKNITFSLTLRQIENEISIHKTRSLIVKHVGKSLDK